jgi:hypothetical protein
MQDVGTVVAQIEQFGMIQVVVSWLKPTYVFWRYQMNVGYL